MSRSNMWMSAALLVGAWAGAPAMAQLRVIAGPVPHNGHWYSLLEQGNWTDSEAAAVVLGGHLVTINDNAEDAFVSTTFSRFGGIERGLWIGLTDEVVEGVFAWASGEPVTYTNWGPGEPNNFVSCGFSHEDYAHILWPGDPRAPRWNDAPDVPAWCPPTGIPFHGVVEAGAAPCYPDCDTSTGVGILDIFDFLCFQNRYDAGAPYACDCDTSTGPGICDIFDFLCFQNAYDAGCP